MDEFINLLLAASATRHRFKAQIDRHRAHQSDIGTVDPIGFLS